MQLFYSVYVSVHANTLLLILLCSRLFDLCIFTVLELGILNRDYLLAIIYIFICTGVFFYCYCIVCWFTVLSPLPQSPRIPRLDFLNGRCRE